jgi:hypothetical protein
MPGVSEVAVTGSPELAETLKNSAFPTRILGIGAKVRVWDARATPESTIDWEDGLPFSELSERAAVL